MLLRAPRSWILGGELENSDAQKLPMILCFDFQDAKYVQSLIYCIFQWSNMFQQKLNKKTHLIKYFNIIIKDSFASSTEPWKKNMVGWVI